MLIIFFIRSIDDGPHFLFSIMGIGKSLDFVMFCPSLLKTHPLCHISTLAGYALEHDPLQSRSSQSLRSRA